MFYEKKGRGFARNTWDVIRMSGGSENENEVKSVKISMPSIVGNNNVQVSFIMKVANNILDIYIYKYLISASFKNLIRQYIVDKYMVYLLMLSLLYIELDVTQPNNISILFTYYVYHTSFLINQFCMPLSQSYMFNSFVIFILKLF